MSLRITVACVFCASAFFQVGCQSTGKFRLPGTSWLPFAKQDDASGEQLASADDLPPPSAAAIPSPLSRELGAPQSAADNLAVEVKTPPPVASEPPGDYPSTAYPEFQVAQNESRPRASAVRQGSGTRSSVAAASPATNDGSSKSYDTGQYGMVSVPQTPTNHVNSNSQPTATAIGTQNGFYNTHVADAAVGSGDSITNAGGGVTTWDQPNRRTTPAQSVPGNRYETSPPPQQAVNPVEIDQRTSGAPQPPAAELLGSTLPEAGPDARVTSENVDTSSPPAATRAAYNEQVTETTVPEGRSVNFNAQVPTNQTSPASVYERRFDSGQPWRPGSTLSPISSVRAQRGMLSSPTTARENQAQPQISAGIEARDSGWQ